MSAQAPKSVPTLAPVPNSKRALAEALLRRKKRRRDRWTDEQKRVIFGRYLAGEHQDDIGVSCGVAGQAIANLIKRAIKEGLEESEAPAPAPAPTPVIHDPKKGRP